MPDNGTVIIVIRKEVENQDKGKDLLDEISAALVAIPDLNYSANFANHYEIEPE